MFRRYAVSLDHVSGFFGDYNRWDILIARDQLQHNGDIQHAQIINALHAKPAAHHIPTPRAWSHSAGQNRMVKRHSGRQSIGQQLFIQNSPVKPLPQQQRPRVRGAVPVIRGPRSCVLRLNAEDWAQ